MELREITDRAEITDLVVRYTRAIDRREWGELDSIFSPNAEVDYSAFGGVAGSLEQAKEFLAQSMPVFSKTQHMLGLPAIQVDGDRATAVTPCHNPMLMGSGKDAKIMVCSLWYHHELERTAGGWRISRLSEERNFMTMPTEGDILPS